MGSVARCESGQSEQGGRKSGQSERGRKECEQSEQSVNSVTLGGLSMRSVSSLSKGEEREYAE